MLGQKILYVTKWAIQKPKDHCFVLCFFNVYFRELGIETISVRKPLFIFRN